MMEATRSSETLVPTTATRRDIPEDDILHIFNLSITTQLNCRIAYSTEITQSVKRQAMAVQFRLLAVRINFLLLQASGRILGAHAAPYAMGIVKKPVSVKLSAHLHLLSRSTMVELYFRSPIRLCRVAFGQLSTEIISPFTFISAYVFH
jgi:hypothetical protein